jgi:hypothetical protein
MKRKRVWLLLVMVTAGTAALLGGLYALSMRDAAELPFFYRTR